MKGLTPMQAINLRSLDIHVEKILIFYWLNA